MSVYVPPEINIGVDSILLVGRDPGAVESAQGRPFVGPAGRILWEAAADIGMRRTDFDITNVVPYQPPSNDFRRHNPTHITEGTSELYNLIRQVQPAVVVALGNEAAHTLIPGWPSRNGRVSGSHGVQNRRGYIFTGRNNLKVIPTIHPALVMRTWVPWRVLLAKDLLRAKEEASEKAIKRPVRNVHVVANMADAQAAIAKLSAHKRIAADIELARGGGLACVGFAPSRSRAFVFTGNAIGDALSILSGKTFGRRRFVFCNGQFDTHYLLTRYGCKVNDIADDIMVAWHSLYPELAGKSDVKSYKATRKSLAFLASIMTNDAWWKDYDFQTPHEQFVLNGRDCCITFDIMAQLRVELHNRGCNSIYQHTMSLIWPVVSMQARGLRVNEPLRRSRRKALRQQVARLEDEIKQLAIPLIKENLKHPQIHLFKERWTCPCCRGGSKKSQFCWSCAGFSKKPSAKEIAKKPLKPCLVCGGDGKRESLAFNPASPTQQRILLYDMLRVSPKYSKGKLSVDESALKNILAEVQQ